MNEPSLFMLIAFAFTTLLAIVTLLKKAKSFFGFVLILAVIVLSVGHLMKEINKFI